MITTHKGAVLDELDKTMIGKMMPLLNEYQQRAFLGPYYEKLGYESAINTSDFTGISPMTLTAAKREVAEHENNSRARP